MADDLIITNGLPGQGQAAGGSGNGGVGGGGGEDTLSKYKRLLSMARSSLEANQVTLASKDQQIAQLMSALEEERAKRLSTQRNMKDDENGGGQVYPRRILCRVDIEDTIWILFEYESQDDDWKSFSDELSLQDFIKRVPGIPLVCPQKCLSAEEASHLMEESKRRVEKVVEEFRRYKVRTEMALKQKETEHRPSNIMAALHHHQTTMTPPPSSSSTPGGISQALEKALSLGASGGDLKGGNVNRPDEVKRLQQSLQETETRWRQAYETLSKETEMLRTKGAEAVVAAQWRTRYETCAKERDDLQRRLQIFSQLSEVLANSDQSLDTLYMELSEAYKGMRRRLLAFVQQHSGSLDNSSSSASIVSPTDDLMRELANILEAFRISRHEDDMAQLHLPHRNGDSTVSVGNDHPNKGSGMVESKVQYVRQMIFQYFLCNEDEVKRHIESALMAIFRFSEEEKTLILQRRREEEDVLGLDAISSITTFLGSFTTSASTSST